MQATVEDINSVQRRVRIELSSKHVDEAFDSVFKKLQKKAQIRGFRPGKAPLPMIRKMYGQNAAADVADQLIKTHLFDAMEQKEIRPVATPALESAELPKPGEAYTFSVLIDVLPKLELATYKGLKVKCTKRNVEPKDVATELERIQKQSAKHRATEDGVAATKSMIAHFDLVTAGIERKGLTVEIGAGDTFPEVDEALEGMLAGSSKEVACKVMGQEETVNRTVKLNELKELVLPTLDDEFAKDLGYESLKDLEDIVRSSLQKRASDLRHRELEAAVLGELLRTHEFDVPPAMVSAVIDDIIEQRHTSPQEKKAAQADQEYRKSLIEAAKNRARSTLIIWEVGRAESIEVNDDDIDIHYRSLLGLTDGQGAEEKTTDLLERLKKNTSPGFIDNLKIEKTIRKLIEWSDVEEVAAAS